MPVEIPSLPVLVPATTIAVAAVMWWLRLEGRLTPLRTLVGILVCVYGAGVLAHVLLPFTIDTGSSVPWRVWLHLTPLVDTADDPIGLVLNILLFVPLGLLLPLVARVESVRRAALCGFLVSLVIEATQLLGDLTVSPGRVADVDDLIGNTAGTMVGYLAFSLLSTVPAVARVATRASWTSDTGRATSTSMSAR